VNRETTQHRIAIASDGDIVEARLAGRCLAETIGFAGSDLVIIATVISEIARNILEYAGSGEIELTPARDGSRGGIVIIARDQGPGIEDIELAMQEGYSSGRGLGLGLPGARRLMDEFQITSRRGGGTTVIMKKWMHS
jgi:serine/threonine-protein kinase RsbT